MRAKNEPISLLKRRIPSETILKIKISKSEPVSYAEKKSSSRKDMVWCLD